MGVKFSKEDTEFDIIPEGKYRVIVNKVDDKMTKSGTGRYYNVNLVIVDGEHKGKQLFANFNYENPNPQAVAIGKRQFFQFCNALYANMLNVDSEIEPRDLAGKTALCQVKHREFNGALQAEPGFWKVDIENPFKADSGSTDDVPF